jgi:hypothetical protein
LAIRQIGFGLDWTAGIFWQVAKETSTEELRSTNIEQVFNTLYGFTPASFYGGIVLLVPHQAELCVDSRLRHLLQQQHDVRPPGRGIR